MKRLFAVMLCAAALVTAQGPRRAPSFCLPDASLQFRDLLDYRGKVVVLEFMKTDCPHCAAFADTLKLVQEKYAGKVQVLAAANTNQDNPKTVQMYMTGHKVNYPVMFDMGQVAFSYIRHPNMDLPHVYVIDANGYIAGDYGYDLTTRDVFEGRALLTKLDSMLGGGAKQ